ncbi:MAG: hypothetical protein ABSC37_01585 [Xanthobacteraceae bacterium]
MALTAVMFVVLIASYALMFGLVRFTENVIATPESVSTGDSGAARASDTKNAL